MAEITVHYDGPIVTRAEALRLGMDQYFTGKPCKHGHIAARSATGNCLECSRRRRVERIEKARLAERRYRKNHLEERRAADRERAAHRRRDDPEKVREINRQWRTRNPDRVRQFNRETMARRRKIQRAGDFTQQQKAELLALQKGRCAICGKSLGKDMEADHIVPMIAGGPHRKNNIQIVHRRCNQQKGPKDPIEFARVLGRLL